MGSYRTAYLGPYAEFVLPLKTQKRDMCPKPAECPNAQSGQFCPHCGMELNKRYHEYQHTDPPIHEILVGVLSEALLTADGITGPQQPDRDTVIYRVIKNQARPGEPRSFYLDDDCGVWVPIPPSAIPDEIAWFRRAFAPEWETLQELYGKFEFRWGFLQWYI